MGTENPSHTFFPFRPSATPFSGPRSASPFTSSGPVVGGAEVSSFRPPPSTAGSPFPTNSLSSGPLAGPIPPSRSNDPAGLPPSSYGPSQAGSFQRFPSPHFPSPGQAPIVPPPGRPASHLPSPASLHSQPQPPPTFLGSPLPSIDSKQPGMGIPQPPSIEFSYPPPGRPASHLPSPVSLHSQPQPTPTFLGSPPPSIDSKQPGMGIPQPPSMEFSYPTSRPNSQPSAQQVGSTNSANQGTFQPAFSGYLGRPPGALDQPSPANQASFPPQQSGFPGSVPVAHRPFHPRPGGYMQTPPYGPPSGMYSREQQPPVPPTGFAQGLVEDFSSLSLGSVPGSFDSGVDTKSLPRPLGGDVEPKTFADMFPMNCNSRYLRLTTCALPNSQSLASRWHLPLGAVVCPLAEAPEGEEVPVVNFGSSGIIRCRRCRTYVNPYVTFTDSGRKWKCNICSLLNDVAGEYFAHLDATGKRIDLDQRPELTKGSVEFIAPAEYMVRAPMPPLYFFLIDVSNSAVRSGMLEVIAQTIRSSLDTLPGFPRTQIGFITFDSTVHFYNMKSTLMQPQMMVVSDIDDIFIPLPDDLLVNLSESRTVVNAFLDSLPSMFQDNLNVESAFGPALKSAFMLMSQLGGKLFIFQNSIPSLGAGRLRLRGDDARVYGTDKEHTLRLPEDPFYKQMAADFSKYQIAVNIYAFSDKYTDIATLGTLAKYTGGQVYYYPKFSASIHKDKLIHELARDLTRETAWEAVMRIRCGKGVRFTSYHGNFMLRSTDLMALPAVDCDKAYAMQLCLEETLMTTQTVYFQVALLFTSSSGERRIRVHTAAAPVASDLGDMYRLADTGAIVSLLSRLAIEKSLSSKLEDVRNSIQLRLAKAFREYRSLYATQHRLGGRVIYPESLKFLPLYALALCKSTPIRGGFSDVQLDERCAAGYTVMALPVKKLLKLLYPNLIRVDEILLKTNPVDDSGDKWKRLPLTADSLDYSGIYIYDDGFRFVIWFGRMLSPEIARNLLGEDFATDYSKVFLTERDNDVSQRLTKLVQIYRKSDPSYYQLCHILRQGEQPREGFFLLANLLEDHVGGTHGYAEWFVQLFRQVQNS